MRKIFFLFLFSWCFLPLYAYTINIQADAYLLQKPIAKYTLEDVKVLFLKAGATEVLFNSPTKTEVNIILPIITHEEMIEANSSYPVVPVVNRSYLWEGETIGNQYVLKLDAHSYEGISAGLYGLLQEVLNFNFYHPRAMQIPDLKTWLLQDELTYSSRPRFNKMGFHLHTMHPTELTESLLDENFPGGEKRIKEYIDWLARNRQNYMEFNLLETINRKEWPAYAQKWVKYMKDRGVIAGLDLSLHMKQQSAYKLYRNPQKSFRTKEKQILKRFNELTVADWDYWNVEFSETEFSSGNAQKKAELRAYVHSLLLKKGIHLTGREHVVKPETMVNKGKAVSEIVTDSLDKYRGTMIHTVMFYTLNDILAPVYGNENLLHMRDMLLQDRQQRETWYYPESAYWVTFDNSIPLFLTPYLNARLEDILYCDSLNIEGHLTFSSGWEWSYWLIDWSIANWSWSSEINGKYIEPYPEQYFDKLIPYENSIIFFKEVNKLQNLKIKAGNLMQYLTAATVTDEMPMDKNFPLHPMPARTYEYLRNRASLQVLDSVEQNVISALKEYNEEYQYYRQLVNENELKNLVYKEIVESLDMVALRTQHRAATMQYLIDYRKSQINKDSSAEKKALTNLETAKNIREEGIKIVRSRESNYRYPVNELATKRPDHTSYHFGYLYPVHDLHFWEREEGQALNNKWKFWYKNIWNVGRIIGIVE
ncbi:MAG TPA: hypothetical protein VLZ75_02740 [Chitinophagales bacterium]|nr:hypothetical protein [Chitinophagales bacterium]